MKTVLNHGGCSDSATAEVIVWPSLGTYSLLQNILAPKWSEQHQHHQFRTWMEDVARYESESGMVIDDHLKIATAMTHLRGSIREHLLINSKPLTPWEDIRLLIDNFFSNSYIQQASRPGSTNLVQQDDVNFIREERKRKRQRKGQRQALIDVILCQRKRKEQRSEHQQR